MRLEYQDFENTAMNLKVPENTMYGSTKADNVGYNYFHRPLSTRRLQCVCVCVCVHSVFNKLPKEMRLSVTNIHRQTCSNMHIILS